MISTEKLNFSRRLLIAFQHLLTMVPASAAVPLILGNSLDLDAETTALLVSANFFVNGIAVLIQTVGLGKYIGGKLPIVFGASFVPLAPMILIGREYGLATAFGAVIASSVFTYMISFRMGDILKLFPKVVVGSFVTLIGISLAPIAMSDLAGGVGSENYGSVQNIVVGFTVFLIVIAISKLGRDSLKPLSLIIGIVSGTVIGWAFGMIDISGVMDANWISTVAPFSFGRPEFKAGPVTIMIIFSIVNIIQCFGAFSVLDEVLDSDTEDRVKIKAVRAQILSQTVGGVFGALPTTVFNENIGIMDITKVSDKSVIKMAGIMLIGVGLMPKMSAILTVIPKPVLGGVTLALFGIIISAGISILSKVDFSNSNNFTIAGTSIAIGVGANFSGGAFESLPGILGLILGNGMFMASVSAVILNLILNKKPRHDV